MPISFDINLVRSPGICGGRLRIDGTRMTVNQIVTLHKQGLSATEIVDAYPQRTLTEIHAVISWYYDHQDEVDEELSEEARMEDKSREGVQRPASQ